MKIASELNRVASESNVADHEGEYKNFTGTIDWKGTKGTVENATFKLKDEIVVWEDGTWEDGTWEDGVWKKGKWYGGNWEGGHWISGYWDYGNWGAGIWEDGTWMDGKWYGGCWK